MPNSSGIFAGSLGRITSLASRTITSLTTRPAGDPPAPFSGEPAESDGRSPFGGMLTASPSIRTDGTTMGFAKSVPRSTSKRSLFTTSIGGTSRRPLCRNENPSLSTRASSPRPRVSSRRRGEAAGKWTRSAASSTWLSNRRARYSTTCARR